jgi:hypothetical protein
MSTGIPKHFSCYLTKNALESTKGSVVGLLERQALGKLPAVSPVQLRNPETNLSKGARDGSFQHSNKT